MGFELTHRINDFNARYAAALDERRFSDWPNFFAPTARYAVQGRENFDRGLPLCLMDLQSQAMMQDRVYGITQTIYHGPYYTRHVIGTALLSEHSEGMAKAEANFAVFRTKPGAAGHGTSEVYAVGRYVDEFAFDPATQTWLLQDRRCVLDSENILNSLIYPL
jgi:salicylate 5-hydroxylase small subunit